MVSAAARWVLGVGVTGGQGWNVWTWELRKDSPYWGPGQKKPVGAEERARLGTGQKPGLPGTQDVVPCAPLQAQPHFETPDSPSPVPLLRELGLEHSPICIPGAWAHSPARGVWLAPQHPSPLHPYLPRSNRRLPLAAAPASPSPRPLGTRS